MGHSNFAIYLISLDQDTARRQTLQQRFPETWPKITHISAIDGRQMDAGSYFRHIASSLREERQPMTPAEVGCALSHIAALEAFLESGADQALILEDDILGDDSDIQRALSIGSSLSQHDLLICGGQEGLKSRKHQFGKRHADNEFYTLAPFSYRYTFRSCCFIIGRPAAERIVNMQKKSLRIADDWDAFFRESSFRIHLINLLSHPEDLSGSLIETERASANMLGEEKARSLAERIRNRRFRAMRKIRVALLLLRGYRPVH